MPELSEVKEVNKWRLVLSLFPLVPYLAWHLFAVTGAAQSRESFLERVQNDHALVHVSVLLLSLLAVAVLAFRDGERERLGWLALVLTIALVAFHGWFLAQASDGRALYVTLRHRLASPPVLIAYLVGLAGLALHLMEAIAALGKRRGELVGRRWELLGMVVAAGCFVLSVNALAPFARGRAFLFVDDPAPVAQSPEVR